MPIYEYQAVDPGKGCDLCRRSFERLQRVTDAPVARCPRCGQKVRKIISWCHSAVTDVSEAHTSVEKQIKNYERDGMWSHAAELADKQSEKTKDRKLKNRALDNYKKAGYDVDSLAKHAESDS
jgi:putative FmdB family regulatory protein